MGNAHRLSRLAAISVELAENPARIYPLTYFCQRFNLAKSTISEDMSVIDQAFRENGFGSITSFAGAAGGVCYMPAADMNRYNEMLQQLAEQLMEPRRQLAGGFVFYSDLISNPAVASAIGRLFAGVFSSSQPNCVLTLETKGIPIALFTAHYLNCPLLVARRNNRVTEGPTVSTNYLTGSARRIETMFLPRRSLNADSRVLIIDDFMKAGGAARGLAQLVGEFDAAVVGTGVMAVTREPAQKLVSDYVALLELDLSQEGQVHARIVGGDKNKQHTSD